MTIRLVSISILLYFFFLTNLIKANPQDSITVSTNRIGRIDSLLKTIDKLHDRANEIETLSEKGFNLAEIKSGLPQIVAELKTLKLNLGASAQVLDLKSLQAFATMLDQSHQQLNTWRNVLLGYNQQLVNMQAEIEGLHENKLLISFKSDQLFISLYTKELNAIETSWNKAKIFTGKNLHDISDLQATVNTNYYLTRDLQKELDLQIRDYSVRIIGAEYPLIWKSYDTNVDREALNLINSSVVSQEKLIIQYFRENIAYQLLLTTSLLALFIYWVKKNQSKLLSEGKRKEWEGFLKGGAISSFALLPGLIIVFNLAPFFDLNPPQAYILLLQLLLFVVVSIFIFRHWPKKDKLYWLKIGISFFVFIAINAVSNPGSLLRFALLALNAFLAYNALYFVRKKGVELELSRFAKQVSIIFLLLNIVAIVLNITGRVTLAKVLTNAAIFGFIQIIALSMFTNIIKTAFLLQVHTASIINNGSSLINYEKLNTSVSKVLSIIVVILWIVVFTSNLNIYNAIVEGLGEFLFQVRTVGSTSFTIGNILLFFLVIYLSSLAQKYVGYIFGENQEHSVPGERKGSKVVIAKLIIILVGFLVAILVSGLPVDKITVILGAFGVV
jgi:potassium efflux system protein